MRGNDRREEGAQAATVVTNLDHGGTTRMASLSMAGINREEITMDQVLTTATVGHKQGPVPGRSKY